MNFAKSYRGLNKITTINASKVYVRGLFQGIYNLLQTSLKSKGIDLQFELENEDLQITTDLRTVITELLNKRLGGTDVGTVFPGFTVPTYVDAFI